MSAWGVVAACFCLTRSVAQFYTLRFLLGMAEAGAFPGRWRRKTIRREGVSPENPLLFTRPHPCSLSAAIWYYLYTMLPKEALTLPFSALEASVSTANVLSAPLAAGLLMLDGRLGLADWKWRFLTEGVCTLCIGLAAGTVRNRERAAAVATM